MNDPGVIKMYYFAEHKDKLKLKKLVEMTRACVNADECLKNYLFPTGYGESKAAQRKVNNVKHRAIFYEYTAQTCEGIVSLATSKKYNLKAPKAILDIENSISSRGMSLKDLIKYAFEEILIGGTCLFMPMWPDNVGQKVTKNAHPVIETFKFEEIENFDYVKVDGKEILGTLIVKKCFRKRLHDKYDWENRNYYIIFELNENLEFSYYYSLSDGRGFTPKIYPKINGKRLNFIPYSVANTKNSYEIFAKPALSGLAVLNIGHYRNSGSYEDNIDAHGNGLVSIASDLPRTYWEQKDIIMGTDSALYVGGPGSKADLIQMAANQQAAIAMNDKVNAMIQLGAKILQSVSRNSPAETARMVLEGQTNNRQGALDNLELALNQQLKYLAIMLGVPENEVTLTLNREFLDPVADPHLMREIYAQWYAGLLPADYVIEYDQKTKAIGLAEKPKEIVARGMKEKDERDKKLLEKSNIDNENNDLNNESRTKLER